jgi:hypothetical protein
MVEVEIGELHLAAGQRERLAQLEGEINTI